jgi:hypothetical protein
MRTNAEQVRETSMHPLLSMFSVNAVSANIFGSACVSAQVVVVCKLLHKVVGDAQGQACELFVVTSVARFLLFKTTPGPGSYSF